MSTDVTATSSSADVTSLSPTTIAAKGTHASDFDVLALSPSLLGAGSPTLYAASSGAATQLVPYSNRLPLSPSSSSHEKPTPNPSAAPLLATPAIQQANIGATARGPLASDPAPSTTDHVESGAMSPEPEHGDDVNMSPQTASAMGPSNAMAGQYTATRSSSSQADPLLYPPSSAFPLGVPTLYVRSACHA